MRRIFKQTMLAVLVLGALAFTAPAAQAHRISKADARSRWYYVFNSHCGNGTLWICRDRNVDGDGSCCFPAVAVGDHSWLLSYSFLEEYIPTGNQRYCTVEGRLEHSTVKTWSESCG